MYMPRRLQGFGIYSPSYRRYSGILWIVLMTPSRYSVQEPWPQARANGEECTCTVSHCPAWGLLEISLRVSLSVRRGPVTDCILPISSAV